MSLEQYAMASNYLIAAATGVLALAFVAYLAAWIFARSADVAVGIGTSVTVLAALLLGAGVVSRGLAAQRVPWGNMYEFGCAGILIALVAYLVVLRRWSVDWMGAAVTGFGTTVLGASMTVYVPAGPLVPALHSYWLVIHVLAAMIAGSAFLIGAIASAMFLVKARFPGTAFAARLPSLDGIDRLAFRANAFAFPIWTFAALIAGPIWAQYAWGRYWGWDPKEVWALITWVMYAGYLHARVTAGWKGQAAALLALAGFACFLFNFIGVNLFVPGLHSYAK